MHDQIIPEPGRPGPRNDIKGNQALNTHDAARHGGAQRTQARQPRRKSCGAEQN